LQVAQIAFKNLNPTMDIHLSQGPMDVLDHSCSKMGFGGKMCIDGTRKHDEEITHVYSNQIPVVNKEAIKKLFAEIREINDSLLNFQIPCVVMSVQKERINHLKELSEQLFLSEYLSHIKMVLWVDVSADTSDWSSCLWRVCNNFDPKRDSFIHSNDKDIQKYYATIFIDGTRKTRVFDNFLRDWPNAIVSDEETIKCIDKKWNHLGLGNFVSSPSLKYQGTIVGESAEVKE